MAASFEAAFQSFDSRLTVVATEELAAGSATPGALAPSAQANPPAPVSSAPPPAAQPSGSDEAAKLRRQLIQRAQTLGPTAPGPVGAPSPASTAAEGSGTGSDGQLAKEIEHRYAEVVARRDFFTIMGLPEDASREQVKTTFLQLAKRLHPDRIPPSLAHLSPKVTAVFEAVLKAYEALSDDTRRAAYLEELRRKAQQGPPRPEGNAGDLFKLGELHFRKRDFPSAREHFERAWAIDPQPLYLAASAWALYMDPQRKPDIPKAKQMMAEAIRLDPNCDRAHYQLGVIARVEGDLERAERHFREAVRANPKHLEGHQELRLIEMRKRNPPALSPKKAAPR